MYIKKIVINVNRYKSQWKKVKIGILFSNYEMKNTSLIKFWFSLRNLREKNGAVDNEQKNANTQCQS